jgi:hypothetical protein
MPGAQIAIVDIAPFLHGDAQAHRHSRRSSVPLVSRLIVEVGFGSATCRRQFPRTNVCFSPLFTPKRQDRYREEFRMPLGVRKSPKNEPAVCGLRLMGI